VTSPKKTKPKKPKKIKAADLCCIPQHYVAATPARHGCIECTRFKTCMEPFAKPFVPAGYTKKLLLVIESSPGGKGIDVYQDREVRVLRRLWRAAGYVDNDVAIAAATLCSPAKYVAPSMQQVRWCRPFLLRAIDVLSPLCIIGCGEVALYALTNIGTGSITRARGRRVDVPGLRPYLERGGTEGVHRDEVVLPRVWVTFDPHAVVQGGIHYEGRMLEDFGRASLPHLVRPEHGINIVEQAKAVDTEFSKAGTLLTLGVANKECATATDYDYNDGCDRVVEDAIKETKYLIGHSVMHEVDHLVQLGLAKEPWLRGEDVYDSLLIQRMKDENRGKGSYGLQTLLLSGFQTEPWKDETDEAFKREADAAAWDAGARRERCRLDAWASRILAEDYRGLPADPLRLSHRIQATLHRVHHTGQAVSRPIFDELATDWQRKAEKSIDLLRKGARKAGMKEFEPTNDGHLRELLFERLNLPIKSRTAKTGEPQVTKPILKVLIRENPKLEVLKHLVEFNSYDKLASTWYGSDRSTRAPLKDTIAWRDDLGMLTIEINPLGARTGRRSSGGQGEESLYESDARNSQNWPAVARRMIVSRWKGGRIFAGDYKRLEVVIMAWVSGDEGLLHYFTEGSGYIGVAEDLWKLKVEDGSPEYKVTKALVLGGNYNKQPKSIARDLIEQLDLWLGPKGNLKEHEKATADMHTKYMRRFPGVPKHIERMKRMLAERGLVTNPLGRERHLPHHGPSTPKYWHLINQAVNFPIQSFAAEVTGAALVDCEEALLKAHGWSYEQYHLALMNDPWNIPFSVAINEVHDELDFDLHPLTADEDRAIIETTMREVPTLRRMLPKFDIPLGVDVVVSDSWG